MGRERGKGGGEGEANAGGGSWRTTSVRYARGLEIHRYVFQPQSYRSRREAKRIRGKKRAAGWGRGRKRGKGARGKRAREGWRDSGEEEKRTTAAAAATTTARLNANSFIDWNSKSPSFDSCNRLLHPWFRASLLSSQIPSTPRSAFPSAFPHRVASLVVHLRLPPSPPPFLFVSPRFPVLLLSRA